MKIELKIGRNYLLRTLDENGKDAHGTSGSLKIMRIFLTIPLDFPHQIK
jgi:hypothetical protein